MKKSLRSLVKIHGNRQTSSVATFATAPKTNSANACKQIRAQHSIPSTKQYSAKQTKKQLQTTQRPFTTSIDAPLIYPESITPNFKHKRKMIANTVEEVLAALKVKFFTKPAPLPKEGTKGFCFDILVNVSRSFALVIAQLPEELRDSICIFYLVLRALDTVEDDTKFDKEKKIPLLESFYSKMESRTFSVHGIQSKKKDEVKLLEEFPKVIEAFLALDPKYQAVIKDITKKMGAGMAEFISRDVVTVQDYDLYCHYVAGLVGHGLTDLFACSGLETINPTETRTIANSMGLFLQKVNITRDYFEDIEEDRIFWPKAIWEKHATDIKDFKNPANIQKAVYCLNEMVVNTLDLVPDVLEYCSKLKHQQVFTFCALPQVMAIATLAEVYNNPDVFRKNVKIRKGLTARLSLNSKNMNDVGRIFYYFACKIEKKIDPKDPNATIAKEKIERIKQITKDYGTFSEGTSLFKLAVTATLTAAASVVIYQKKESILSFFSRYLGKKSQ